MRTHCMGKALIDYRQSGCVFFLIELKMWMGRSYNVDDRNGADEDEDDRSTVEMSLSPKLRCKSS